MVAFFFLMNNNAPPATHKNSALRGVNFIYRPIMKSYFKNSEFECKCGCGKNNINGELLEDLNIARVIAGVPFIITSGTRCATHNKREGGLPNSSHVTGHAVDIRADDSRERFMVLMGLISAGFQRIGISKHFIHVDNDTTKPPQVAWLY